MILTEICHDLNNWFECAKFIGKFTITDGVVMSNDDGDMGLLQGQYFRIIGSVFNDGVHLNPATDLTDESFEGAVWAMAIPNEFLLLVSDIEGWQDKYGGVDGVAMSPYASESFGGYSYVKGSSANTNGSLGGMTWKEAFASQLNKWRKIR